MLLSRCSVEPPPSCPSMASCQMEPVLDCSRSWLATGNTNFLFVTLILYYYSIKEMYSALSNLPPYECSPVNLRVLHGLSLHYHHPLFLTSLHNASSCEPTNVKTTWLSAVGEAFESRIVLRHSPPPTNETGNSKCGCGQQMSPRGISAAVGAAVLRSCSCNSGFALFLLQPTH